MITLSKGYKKPETGDFGDVWFPALEDDVQLMNDHEHDGNDGTPISGGNLVATTQTVLSAAFADQGDGYWRATVTVPNTKSIDDLCVTVKDPTSKEVIYLKQVKLSSTQFYIYTNFVQNFELYYGV